MCTKLEKEVKTLKKKLKTNESSEGNDQGEPLDLPGRSLAGPPPDIDEKTPRACGTTAFSTPHAQVLSALLPFFLQVPSPSASSLYFATTTSCGKTFDSIFIGSVILTLTLQTALLNEGLKRGDAMAVFPSSKPFGYPSPRLEAPSFITTIPHSHCIGGSSTLSRFAPCLQAAGSSRSTSMAEARPSPQGPQCLKSTARPRATQRRMMRHF